MHIFFLGKNHKNPPTKNTNYPLGFPFLSFFYWKKLASSVEHLKIDDITPEKLWLDLQLFPNQNGEACRDIHYLVWMKCAGHYLDWSSVHPESQRWRSSNHEHWCMENSFITTEPQKKEPIWILFSSVLWSAKVNKSFSHILYSPNRSFFYLVLQSVSFWMNPLQK